jgi:hypothetical protein
MPKLPSILAFSTLVALSTSGGLAAESPTTEVRTFASNNCLLTNLPLPKPRPQPGEEAFVGAALSTLGPPIISGLIGLASKKISEAYKEKIVTRESSFRSYYYKAEDKEFAALEHRGFYCFTIIVSSFLKNSDFSNFTSEFKRPEGYTFEPNKIFNMDTEIIPILKKNNVLTANNPTLIFEFALGISDDLTAISAKPRYLFYTGSLQSRNFRRESDTQVSFLVNVETPAVGAGGSALMSIPIDLGRMKLGKAQLKVINLKEFEKQRKYDQRWYALPQPTKVDTASLLRAKAVRKQIKISDEPSYKCEPKNENYNLTVEFFLNQAAKIGCFGPVTISTVVAEKIKGNEVGLFISSVLDGAKSDIAKAVVNEITPESERSILNIKQEILDSFDAWFQLNEKSRVFAEDNNSIEANIARQKTALARDKYELLKNQAVRNGIIDPNELHFDN